MALLLASVGAIALFLPIPCENDGERKVSDVVAVFLSLSKKKLIRPIIRLIMQLLERSIEWDRRKGLFSSVFFMKSIYGWT